MRRQTSMAMDMRRPEGKAMSEGDGNRPENGQGAAGGTGSREDERRDRKDRIVIGSTRFIAIIPSIGLFAASIALMIVTLIATVQVTAEAIEGTVDILDLMVDYIEYADFFLLAIVLYIMAIGLYSLFIDDDIPMPHWLEIHDLEDLKEKLIGVIVVVMGVYFLGRLIHGTDSMDILCLGVGIAAVVFALGYFSRYVIIGDGSESTTERNNTLIVAHHDEEAAAKAKEMARAKMMDADGSGDGSEK